MVVWVCGLLATGASPWSTFLWEVATTKRPQVKYERLVTEATWEEQIQATHLLLLTEYRGLIFNAGLVLISDNLFLG